MIYVAIEKCECDRNSQHKAGIAARERLFSFFGITGEIKTADRGKPYVDGNNTYFSISHSGNIAVCALRVSKENYGLADDIITVFENGEGEVGIDIELLPDSPDMAKYNRIANRFFGLEFSSAESFLCHWTKTEATAKAKGSPLATEFRSTKEKEYFTGRLQLEDESYIFTIAY